MVLSESSKDLLVFLDTALLECIGGSRETLQCEMLVGRLSNAGWALSVLQRALGHDPRTVKKWTVALLSNGVDVEPRGTLTPPEPHGTVVALTQTPSPTPEGQSP